MSTQVWMLSRHPDSVWIQAVWPGLADLGEPVLLADPPEGLPADLPLLIIVDASSQPGGEARELVASLRSRWPTAPVIVASASPTWQRARDLLKIGASDYVTQSLTPDKFLARCRRALRHTERNAYRILIAENNQDHREDLIGHLKRLGFEVTVAASADEARELLGRVWFHLAVLDVRLQDDFDPLDRSGITIAYTVAPATPKLLLTTYPVASDVAEVMQVDAHGRQLAIDYLSRYNVEPQDYLEELTGAIMRALEKTARINRDLQIQGAGRALLVQVAHLIGPPAGGGPPEVIEREIEEMLRIFFADQQRLSLRRIICTLGRMALVEAAAVDHAREHHLLLIIGAPTEVARAADHVRHTPSTLVHLWRPMRETLHFGVLALRVHYGQEDRLHTLQDLAERRSTVEICDLLGAFIGGSLRLVYEHQITTTTSGPELLASCVERLGLGALLDAGAHERLAALCKATNRPGDIGLSLTNPIAIHVHAPHQFALPAPFDLERMPYDLPLDEAALRACSEGLACFAGALYGTLSPETILIHEPSGQTWAFGAMGEPAAPLLLDLALLELRLRHHWLAQSALGERYLFELHLLYGEGSAVGAALPPLAGEAERLVTLVRHLRAQARQRIEGSAETYAFCLMLGALQHALALDPADGHERGEIRRASHDLLLAAMLFTTLAGLDRATLPAAALTGLWIATPWDDPSAPIIVEGRQVRLPRAERRILAHLYAHRGEVRTIEQIIEALDGQSSRLGARNEQGRVFAAINRLREAVEPDPHSERYILNRRGQGYLIPEAR